MARIKAVEFKSKPKAKTRTKRKIKITKVNIRKMK